MRFLYPSAPNDIRMPEPMYAEEAGYVVSKGNHCVTFSFEEFEAGRFKKYNVFENDQKLIYRGWMMNSGNYARLHEDIKKCGARLLTSPEEYHACHNLPGWYGYVREFTAPTATIMAIDLPWQKSSDVERHMRMMGLKGTKFFVKDFVKSLPKNMNSVATNGEEVLKIADVMTKTRGLNVGVAIREFENYKEGTEKRYFVFKGVAHSAEGPVPEMVLEVAKRLTSPFFSVDVAEREDGVLRLIEIGDGGVSDLKHWTAKQFAGIFR